MAQPRDDPHLKSAALLIKQGRDAEAEALLQKLLRRRPNNVAALLVLSQIAHRDRRFPEAATHMPKCVALRPKGLLTSRNRHRCSTGTAFGPASVIGPACG